jgi:hypothetical protein
MTRLFRSSISSERLLVTGLILLLAFQLTGLSCINDSQSPSSPSLVNHISSQDGALGGTNDIPDKHADGCPCHLVFQSFLFPTLQPVSLVTSRETPSPAIYTATFVESLFHPPILHSVPHFDR